MELTIEGLTKRYGSEWALREVSLRCEPSLVGLVGPNGAGKTPSCASSPRCCGPQVASFAGMGRTSRRMAGSCAPCSGRHTWSRPRSRLPRSDRRADVAMVALLDGVLRGEDRLVRRAP